MTGLATITIAITSRRPIMDMHPNAMLTISEFRRHDFLRTANQERMAALACATSRRSRSAAVWLHLSEIRAALSRLAATATVLPRRTLLAAPR
jgi:hypothetical protein